MALCTQTQIEQRLQIDFADDNEPVVTELIAAAQGHIEREAQRALEAANHTEVFDAPPTADIWLTNTPVNSITSVTVDGTALATSGAYLVDNNLGRLTRVVNGRPHSWGTHKIQSVSVVYNGGYTTVPADLQDICARAAARMFQAGVANTAGSAGVKQINLAGSDSVTFVDEVNDITAASSLDEYETQVARYYRNQVLA